MATLNFPLNLSLKSNNGEFYNIPTLFLFQFETEILLYLFSTKVATAHYKANTSSKSICPPSQIWIRYIRLTYNT